MVTSTPTGRSPYQPLYVDESVRPAPDAELHDSHQRPELPRRILDGSQVYQNSNLNLGYKQPFHFFLETQTSVHGRDVHRHLPELLPDIERLGNSDRHAVRLDGADSQSVRDCARQRSREFGHRDPGDRSVRHASGREHPGHQPAGAFNRINLVPRLDMGRRLLLALSPRRRRRRLLGASPSPDGSTVQAAAAPASGTVSQVGVATPQSASAPVPVSTTTASPLGAFSLVGVAGFVMHRDSEGIEPRWFPKESKSLSCGREEQH